MHTCMRRAAHLEEHMAGVEGAMHHAIGVHIRHAQRDVQQREGGPLPVRGVLRGKHAPLHRTP